jgi:regulation of enolase protein 1 (concanavalin A-like superfamily)
MAEIILHEDFDRPTLDDRLRWYCPPEQWSIKNSRLALAPAANTDYWQKTHYGFAVDNGHFLYLEQAGNFTLTTSLRFFPRHQYDQAGLMVRFSADCWLKTSVEYEPDEPDRLGVVVTNYGYSDWSTQNYAAPANQLALRIRREGSDFTVEFAEAERPEIWTQIRVAHLHQPDAAPIQAGLYACSPKAAGFSAEFDYLRVEQA